MAASAGDPNLGLLDVVNGLKAVNMYVEYLGGNKSKVTIGGESSGAGLIRGTSTATCCMSTDQTGFLGCSARERAFPSGYHAVRSDGTPSKCA